MFNVPLDRETQGQLSVLVAMEDSPRKPLIYIAVRPQLHKGGCKPNQTSICAMAISFGADAPATVISNVLRRDLIIPPIVFVSTAKNREGREKRLGIHFSDPLTT